jgi:CRISPR-associated protein Csd1
MAKLNEGLVVVRERVIGEIMDGIDNFPSHLLMQEQGNFAIGFYHQRQDFFKKQNKNEEA